MMKSVQIQSMTTFAICGLALLLAGGCNPDSGVPAPDTCNDPAVANAANIEVGAYQQDFFVPFADGSSLRVERGLQGADMVGLRLQLSGSDLPSCIAQSTTLRSESGSTLARLDVPLATIM